MPYPDAYYASAYVTLRIVMEEAELIDMNYHTGFLPPEIAPFCWEVKINQLANSWNQARSQQRKLLRQFMPIAIAWNERDPSPVSLVVAKLAEEAEKELQRLKTIQQLRAANKLGQTTRDLALQGEAFAWMEGKLSMSKPKFKGA